MEHAGILRPHRHITGRLSLHMNNKIDMTFLRHLAAQAGFVIHPVHHILDLLRRQYGLVSRRKSFPSQAVYQAAILRGSFLNGIIHNINLIETNYQAKVTDFYDLQERFHEEIVPMPQKHRAEIIMIPRPARADLVHSPTQKGTFHGRTRTANSKLTI